MENENRDSISLDSGAATGSPTGADTRFPALDSFGRRLRQEREGRALSLRELARRIGVSPSLVSQIERGLVTPSVGTLWSIASELNLTLDELFNSSERSTVQSPPPTASENGPAGPILRHDNRKRIRLAGGVVWERLTAQPDETVDFLHVVYEVGAESCPTDSLFRHGGKEYAYILSGRLGLQIGFETYELGPGDSVSFNALSPHRLWAIGSTPAVAIWAVINRTNDNRSASPD
jgi:DNA-binding XRE family transcriptional regulator/quercetin dioxygenase-like cupin family protein